MSMLLLLTALSFAFAAKPGGKLAVTYKGLQYANQVAGTELKRKLRTVSIPGQSGSEGPATWSVHAIQITGMYGPNTNIWLNPGAGGVTLRVDNFGLSVHADWSGSYQFIFRFSAGGSVDMSVSGVSVTLVAGLGEKNGRPSVYAKSCRCNIGDVDLRFYGGLGALILNIMKGTLRDRIKNTLQDNICDIVNKQVNTKIDEELGKMKVNVEIAKRFILDYSLIRAPTVTNDYIEVATKGTVYWKDNRQESPYTPAELPALSEFSNMLYLDVTEYSANTFAYVAHVNGFLEYNITVDNLPAEASYLLDPTGKLNDHYPNSKLELRVSSASAPIVKFENQSVTIAAVGNVEVVVNTQDEVVTPLSLKVSVSVTADPSVVNGYLTGNIT
ncbi:unnamed protein product, partial [Candidula unifasciata]